jgi:hypothetical protein
LLFVKIERVRWAAIAAFLGVSALAQSLNVYSEFARIDTSGTVKAPAAPREILSPAIVRNGFTSFQIVVQVKNGTSYWLHIGQNPEAFRIRLYTESDRGVLTPADLPFHGDNTQVFWMDVWCDRDAPVRRVKIEPELAVDGDWVRYPMEARVMEAQVPENAAKFPPLDNFCGPLLAVDYLDLAGVFQRWKAEARNQRQDAGLASHVARDELVKAVGCERSAEDNPESYLRIRDYLFRMR